MKLSLSTNLFISDNYYWDPLNRLAQPAYQVLNLPASYLTANKAVKFIVYGNNVADEAIQIYATASAPGNGVAYQKPAKFGVRVEFFF